MRIAGYALFLLRQVEKAASSAAVAKSTKLPGSGTAAIATPGETASESWPAAGAALIEGSKTNVPPDHGQARLGGQGETFVTYSVPAFTVVPPA